jgi:kumamolisin
MLRLLSVFALPRAWAVINASKRVPVPGAIATARTNPHATVEVSLKLRRKKKLPPLDARPAAAITRAELEDRYGASEQDVDTVVAAFISLGLKLVSASAATRTVRLSGSVAALETAFQVKLFNYTSSRGDYRGRIGPLSVPADVRPLVEGVFGLDNRRVVRKRRQPPSGARAARSASVPAEWYKPAELAKHYNFPPGNGAGQAVGVLEFGGGYFPNDLKEFCSLASVAVPNVTAISVDGTATDRKDGAEGEVMLDIEVIAGVCPAAHIVAYFGQWTEQGWLAILDAAVHDKTNDPGVLSVSWGEAEDADIWTAQAMTQINETLQEAAMLFVSVCVAAGDDGSSDAVGDGHAHVDFPGSSPYVLSVGGTTIPSKTGTAPDVVWFEGDGLRADNGGSTGGGVSSVFPRPPWQSAITIQSVNPGSIAGRCVPDLAANADWNASPYLLVVDGSSQPNGGTSAATPLCASLLTLINAMPGAKRAGYVTPVLYGQRAGATGTVGANCCSDVLSGNNSTDKLGGYSAGPGYDAVSGWGTPEGAKLAAALGRPPL